MQSIIFIMNKVGPPFEELELNALERFHQKLIFWHVLLGK